MTPSKIGERTEAAVLAALAAAGKQVLLPFGQCHYDLAYDEKGRLIKVQCKTGVARRGAIVFPTCWKGRGPRRDYRKDADFFGVYCHERGEVYLIPVADVPATGASLRVSPARNGQRIGIRWASEYLLSPERAPSQASLTDIDIGPTLHRQVSM